MKIGIILLCSFLAHFACLTLSVQDCAVCDPPANLGPNGEGALIDIQIDSYVGVLLTDIPDVDRANVFSYLSSRPADYWKERARQQIHYGDYFLTYRADYTAPWKGNRGKGNDWDQKNGQLMLPMDYQWDISISSTPFRGLWKASPQATPLDAVYVSYNLHTVLVTDYSSPKRSDPQLERVGGIVNQQMELPLDPSNLYVRVNLSCNDDYQYALDTYDTSYPWGVFDWTSVASDCKPDNSLEISCSYYHCNKPCPVYDCLDALDKASGRVSTTFVYKRLEWNTLTAANWRSNPYNHDHDTGANLVPWNDIGPTFETYKWFEEGSAELIEGTIDKLGWRQLIQFNSINLNIGIRPMHIGPFPWQFYIGDNGTALCDYHGIYHYGATHGHCHLQNYTLIKYNIGRKSATDSQKRGFCAISVIRQRNDETSPIWNPYSACSLQGISPGWGDVYQIGISGQWKDVTDLQAGSGTLTLIENAWNVLCEGVQQCDANENPIFEARAGISAQPWVCRHPVEDGNTTLDNSDSTSVPHYGCGQGYITQPSPYGEGQEIGPYHDSDFQILGNQLRECTVGKKIRINCTLPVRNLKPATVTDSQVVRICESSKVLGCATACRSYKESLGHLVLTSVNRIVSFDVDCPGPKGPAGREWSEPGGYFSLYRSMLVPTSAGDKPSVTCVASVIN